MNKYDLIERMNSRFAELEITLHQLHQRLDDLTLLAARVFSLPEIEKGTEHQPIEQITVNATEGEQAKNWGYNISNDYSFITKGSMLAVKQHYAYLAYSASP